MWTWSDARSVIPEYSGLIGTALDLENSLVGECLRNGEPIAISVEGSGVRVTANEPEVDLVQFVAVPMRSLLHTHGALYLENHRGTITSHDVTVAELLADLAGEMIAGLREQEREIAAPATVVAASALPAQGDDSGGSDVETFHERLKQELARATDYQSVLTVCFVGVDPLKGLQSSEEDAAIDAVVALIEKRVHEQIREYDLVARVANDTLAIALMAYTSQEAQFWTENLRRDIASSSVNVGSKRVMATISVGVASFEASDTWQSLLEHAETALTMASRQQNKVIVYG
jgi:diguanylate cyclase (GGDEF)-like protein